MWTDLRTQISLICFYTVHMLVCIYTVPKGQVVHFSRKGSVYLNTCTNVCEKTTFWSYNTKSLHKWNNSQLKKLMLTLFSKVEFISRDGSSWIYRFRLFSAPFQVRAHWNTICEWFRPRPACTMIQFSLEPPLIATHLSILCKELVHEYVRTFQCMSNFSKIHRVCWHRSQEFSEIRINQVRLT